MKAKFTTDAIEIIRHHLAQDPELAAMVEEERERLAIADRLRSAREKAGLTQEELGRRIGTTQSAIARMESGRYERLTLNTLLKVRSALGRGLGIEI